MKQVVGNIVDVVSKRIFKGIIYYNSSIIKIEEDNTIESKMYIIPGFIDAHVHIESSMLTPLEYSKVAVSHGVVAAVTDPHEIANVCGIEGVRYMIKNAQKTPMKLYFGAPSCVPATSFETSGFILSSDDIEQLFTNNECSHLAEMMNYPGVIYDDKEVYRKIEIAHKLNKIIDGHAPLLNGVDLKKYVKAGISTDHECTSVHEALEKISLGMKIMLRNGSAAKDFSKLITLIKTHPNEVMLCTDDCHPDELEKGYINLLVKEALDKGYDLFDVLTASTKTANELYDLNVGLLQENDSADFVVIDNLDDFSVCSTFINGQKVFDRSEGVFIDEKNDAVINNFFKNKITENDLVVQNNGTSFNVIEVIPDSLLTNKLVIDSPKSNIITSDIDNDILKIVVLNRYQKAKPAIGFIKGFGLKKGAIAGTIAHDSHNIVAVGVSDSSIITAIKEIQKSQGALVVADGDKISSLSLPLAGLMSDLTCSEVASNYKELSIMAQELGCTLKAPFMTLAFMSLLVIPELKLGDKGLFDVNKFDFINLQN